MDHVKTKIVATVGPATRSPDMLERLIREGVDVFRFNLSHGTQAEHTETVENLRRVAAERSAPVAALADLSGPKVRTGEMDGSRNKIAAGDTCRVVRGEGIGTAEQFTTNYEAFVDEIQVGERILIDDGAIRLTVREKGKDALVCECQRGGVIGDHKGLNVPDSTLTIPPLTEKDRDDIRWAAARKFDYVALSFVRQASDVAMLRHALEDAGSAAPIISKIETPQALRDISAIIDASDAILVARGDLGVEIDVWRVPTIQKDLVRRCQQSGTPVIIATQMLQSMVTSATPTRAEVSDVANAVLDGADAVMLSAESAVGRYPIESVAMLNHVAEQAETLMRDADSHQGAILDPNLRVGMKTDTTAAAVARSAALIVADLRARLVVSWCRTGRTTRWLSKYRLPAPVLALSHDEGVCRQMSLVFGVRPMHLLADVVKSPGWWESLRAKLVPKFNLQPGDPIVLVGDPNLPYGASTLTIEVI